jgi:hypothetical protein
MTAQTLFNRALTLQERFLPNWDEVVIARARAIDISTRRPLEFKVQRAWPGGPEWSSLPIEIDRLRAAGDRILYHAEHVGDDAKRFLNTILPGHRDEEQLQLLFESTNKMLRSRENRANLRSVINAEIQRRNLVHRVLLKLPGGEQFASKVSMTWTSWGERLRLDPFDWLRGHVNFTPTGLIKSLSFFPKTAYRGVIKMYQDGSIGGHISALPKNFLNGIFRAIVEIDEHGALVGNIRIVPKGPLNVTFNFITRMPKEVADNLADEFTHYLMLTRGDVIHNMSARMVADHLVDFLGSHASPLGFKPRDLAYGVARRLTEEGLVTGPLAKDLTEQIIARGAQLTFDPRDIYTAARTFGAARVARDLGYVVRQFKFHSAKVEWRIFNKSIFDISANLRIPIDAVKRVVEDLSLQNLLTKNFDGTYSGLFRWVMTNPVEVFKTIQVSSRHLAEETGAGIKSTLFGGIRFSGLRAVENNPFLRALQRGNVRFLSRLHFDQDGLRSVATNMKIFGWNVYDIANVLALRAQEVKALVDEGFASMHLMSYRLGFTKLDDAIPNWDRTVETMRKMFSSSIEGEGPVSRAEALDRVVTAMGNKFTNPVDERALRYLADILPSDGPRQIQLKLLHLRNWINNVEAREGIVYRDWSSSGVLNPFGFQGLPPGVKAEYLEVYQKIGKAAQHLTMDDLIAKSHEMYRKGRHMRLVDPLAPIKGGFDLDYYFGRFQTYFIARGEALAVIQRNWERLVTNFEIATRKFVPTSYSVTRLEPEQYATIANWKRLAVEESPTSFRVGETRFFIELFDEAEQMLGPNTLLNAVDDDFVKESLRLQLYTRKRFPNLEDMPGIRITTDRAYVANAGQFSYLQGNINVHAEWAFNYAKTQADVSDIIRYEARSGVVPTGRRYTGDNIFDRLMLHETAHWLTDHLTEAEIHELVDVIADRTSLNLHWITNPKYIEQRLTDIAALPFDYKTRDPLGSSFMAWRRQVVLRDELRINQAPNNLRAVERNIVRITGEYGAMNIDEMISENMSHYLYHRDPTNLSRIIGGFYDEKLLGRQAARMVDQARPVGGEVVADQRDVIERVFNHEVPSNMTDDFKKRALRIARTFDGEEDTAQAMQEALFPYRHYQGETLDTSVLHYWAEDNSQVTTIRAAWEEMHGIARPEVAYNDRDVAAAIHLDKMWEKYSYPDKKKMFRGITYETVGNTPQQAHAEELMKVGNTFELPFSSFTEEDWMAATYSHLDKPFTRGIFVELEGGAQRLPVVDKDFGLADLTATTVGRNLEALTKGTFEVVSVTPRWTPSKRVIENLIKEYGLELDFSDEELEEQKAEFSQMMQDKVTKVVLRRVVDTVSPRVGG